MQAVISSFFPLKSDWKMTAAMNPMIVDGIMEPSVQTMVFHVAGQIASRIFSKFMNPKDGSGENGSRNA